MSENKPPQTVWRIFKVLLACVAVLGGTVILLISLVLMIITDPKLLELFFLFLVISFCCLPIILWILYPFVDRHLKDDSSNFSVVDYTNLDNALNKRAYIECNTYLLIFIIINIIEPIILFYYDIENIDTWIIVVLLINYSVLTYCSYKRKIVPLLIMAGVMIISFTHLLNLAVFLLLIQQQKIILGIITIFVSFLLVYGGVRIIYLQDKILHNR